MTSEDIPLIVVGGNGLTGHYLLQQLAEAQQKAFVISRKPMELPALFKKITVDLNQKNNWTVPSGATVISLLPLWLLTKYLDQFVGIKAIIATSSTSLYAKAKSKVDYEREVADLLRKAEATLEIWSEKNHVNWTILRPTIIYDCKNDKNITRLAEFIKRWHFLPLAMPALGLRQPIHASDVAKATLKCLNNPGAANKSFNIAGGEILTYRTMVKRIFEALGKKPYLIMLPTFFLKMVFMLATKMGFVKETSFGAAFFERMNDDLVFDVKEGIDVLRYEPRSFNPFF